MIMVCVRLEILQIFLQIRRINLPILFRKLQHLMPGVLDRPGFMNTHVPCLRCYYALIRCKHAADHGRIRLGTAHQKINLRLRASGRLLYFSGGTLAVPVHAISRQTLPVRLRQLLEYLLAGAFCIIACK